MEHLWTLEMISDAFGVAVHDTTVLGTGRFYCYLVWLRERYRGILEAFWTKLTQQNYLVASGLQLSLRIEKNIS